MILDDPDLSPDELLTRLDVKGGPSWLTTAQVLAALEARTRRGPDGRLWLEIVRDRLERGGHPKTLGHLRKMRRSYDFVRREWPHLARTVESVPWGDVVMTALETAERIARLDRDAGRRALQACLGGAPSAKIQEMYEAVRAEHADQLTARQLAWDTRREAVQTRGDRNENTAAIEDSFRADPGTWWDMPGAGVLPFSPGKIYPWLKSDEAWFTITSSSGAHVLGGARLARIARGDTAAWLRLLEAAQFRATFLDRYWLILAADPVEAEKFQAWLEILQSPNIGLGLMSPTTSAQLTRLWLGQDAPTPDRRGLIRNALLQRGA